MKEFGRKTGDISSLSDVDMELIALTHMMYLRHGKEGDLRKDPPPIKEQTSNEAEQDDEEDSDPE